MKKKQKIIIIYLKRCWNCIKRYNDMKMNLFIKDIKFGKNLNKIVEKLEIKQLKIN